MIALVLSALLAGTVVLRSDARIAGPTVELGEIAEFEGLDAATVARLSALQVGPAPAPGNVRGVRRQDAATALRSAGIDLALIGAPLCRARADVAILPAIELENAARDALGTMFSGRDCEIEVTRLVVDLAVPVAEHRRALSVDLGRREPQPGSWNVPVEVDVDGVRVQTVWITLDVKLYEAMPVAVRPLRRGDPIDAACWKLERSLVEASGPRPATPAGLLGATSTRDLPAGLRIAETDVRRDPLVRNGDSVELEVIRGPIRARSRAVARGQGALGDRVEVQCGEGQRRLVGIVVQRGLVRVELAASPRIER